MSHHMKCVSIYLMCPVSALWNLEVCNLLLPKLGHLLSAKYDRFVGFDKFPVFRMPFIGMLCQLYSSSLQSCEVDSP